MQVNLYAGYNVFLFLCPLAMGVFDKDVTEETVKKFPALYRIGREKRDLNTAQMVRMFIRMFFHSFIIIVFPFLASESFDDGVHNGVYMFGTVTYCCLLSVMWYRWAFMTWTWNKYVVLAFVLSTGLFAVALFGYSRFPSLMSDPLFYKVIRLVDVVILSMS